MLPTVPLRIAEHARERALPRQADENRPADAADPLEPADQREVLVGGLAEADPGIEADVLLGDPRCHRDRQPILEKPRHLADDVVVARLDLHRARLALHVHEADVRAGIGDHAGERRVGPQRGDVVDERDAELERPARDLGLRGVDRDGQAARAPRAPAAPAAAPRRADTGSAPGRVDSPPMSTRAAPSASSRRAVSTATPGSTLSPPSEKLSGVTLTTPITDGRGQHSARGGRLTRRWRVATMSGTRRRAVLGLAALRAASRRGRGRVDRVRADRLGRRPATLGSLPRRG